MYNLDPKIKTYVKYFLYATVFMVLMWFLYSFLTTASVEIVTNDQNNTIIIRQTSPQQKEIDMGNKTGNVKKRLATGTYTATVKNGYNSAQQIFTLSIGDFKKITINVDKHVDKASVLEPISDLGAYSIVADKNSVKFLNRNVNPAKLYSIDNSNTVKNINPNYNFDIVSWADTSFGVGHMGYQLYTIKNDVVESVSTPVSANTIKTFSVAKNQDVYISDGRAIYRGVKAKDFNKIYTAPEKTNVELFKASDNAVAFSEKADNSNREGNLAVINKSGVKHSVDGGAYESAWSKNGKYIVTSGDSSTIFNDKLEKVVNLPIGNVSGLTWIDDNTLIYSQANLVWKFSVDTRSSEVIAMTNNGVGTISEITSSADDASLYISVQNPDITNGYTFYLARYKLNSKPILDPLLQKVSLILPNTPVDGCSIGYANLNKLTITMSSVDRIQQLCIDSTKNYLKLYNVDSNSLNFQFIPVS